MSEPSVTTSVKAAARTIERVLRPLFAPAIIAGVLSGFLMLTYAVASLVAVFLGSRARLSFFALWAITTAAGVALVRLLPRILK